MTYSWGQIRLLLQQFAGPGVSLDTIDNAINARYSQILAVRDWQGIAVSGMLETVAAYRTGTVTVTQGSTAVVGTDTVWLSAMTGQQLLCLFGQPYTVSIVNATTLTLDRPYEGPTTAAMGYIIGQVVYQLPDNCRSLTVIKSPWTGLAIPQIDDIEFARLEGSALVDGPVRACVPQPDGVNPQTGETVRQIMLWPVPTYARGFPIIYESEAEGFDGDATPDGPAAFVSCFALLAGCKADLEMEKPSPNLAKAQGMEAMFQAHLAGMSHVENSKKPYPQMRMAPVFTRHRIERVVREMGDNNFHDVG